MELRLLVLAFNQEAAHLANRSRENRSERKHWQQVANAPAATPEWDGPVKQGLLLSKDFGCGVDHIGMDGVHVLGGVDYDNPIRHPACFGQIASPKSLAECIPSVFDSIQRAIQTSRGHLRGDVEQERQVRFDSGRGDLSHLPNRRRCDPLRRVPDTPRWPTRTDRSPPLSLQLRQVE